jgi:hypothetical protein
MHENEQNQDEIICDVCLEDDDFDFLTSEKFFEQMSLFKPPAFGGDSNPAKSIK